MPRKITKASSRRKLGMGTSFQTGLQPEPPLPPVAPKTTLQEDLTTAGQRRVNLIWEFTQAAIAFAITLAVIWCAIYKQESAILTNAFFLIVSMYFVRTNHQRIGGIGTKVNETPAYFGR